jgi:hypothetical protein
LGGWSPLLTKPNYICKIFESLNRPEIVQ